MLAHTPKDGSGFRGFGGSSHGWAPAWPYKPDLATNLTKGLCILKTLPVLGVNQAMAHKSFPYSPKYNPDRQPPLLKACRFPMHTHYDALSRRALIYICDTQHRSDCI